MAKVNFKRVETIKDTERIPIEDGNLIVTADGNMFLDYDKRRVAVGGTSDTEMSDESTNSVQNKVIKEYVDAITKSQSFSIEKNGDWTVKKYTNGYLEMYHKTTVNIDITKNYIGTNGHGTLWADTPLYKYPIELIDLYSANTTILSLGHLSNFNYSICNNSSYQGYVYDDMSLPKQPITFYTTIVGTWK